MSGSFWARHDAARVSPSAPQLPLTGAPEDDDDGPPETDRTFEVPDERDWDAIQPIPPAGWRASEWGDRPVRFIDGKDVGETVACLTAPFGGYPVPVRLSEIGAIVVREEDGTLRRERATVERVVTMATDLFPWDEIEDLAISLRRNGFRLLSAPKPVTTVNGQRVANWSYDYEVMRKAAQNASNTEMGRLEESALALDNTLPTVVDGRLEPREGGLQPRDPCLGSWEVPAIGVVKTHLHAYLHAGGMRLLYRLKPGQRTPAFLIDPSRVQPGSRRPKVVSWFIRLAQQPTLAPNEGLIRVELPLPWFTRTFGGPTTAGWAFIDRLTVLLREYRCRDAGYGRAAISLQPIVRAEQLLGALFTPHATLARRFYRSQGL
jgi:hypothetical protein